MLRRLDPLTADLGPNSVTFEQSKEISTLEDAVGVRCLVKDGTLREAE